MSRTKSRKPGTFVPGDPRIRRGRGPAKGAPNAGRPPELFRQGLRELANHAAVVRRLEKILTSPKTSATEFLVAYKYVCDRAYGRVPTVIEGGDERKPLVIRLVRESRT